MATDMPTTSTPNASSPGSSTSIAPAPPVRPQYHSQHSLYQFVFEGNCTRLQTDLRLNDAFLSRFHRKLVSILHIALNRIETGPIACGSVIINSTISNTQNTSIDDQIMEYIASGNFSFTLPLFDDNSAEPLHFQAAGVKVLLSPSLPRFTDPTQVRPDDDGLFRGFWELSDIERILILVFSILGGFLLIMAGAYFVHVCCMNGRAKSFDLGDGVDRSVNLEDFTLTKLDRPATIYDERGMILTGDLGPGETKMAIPYGASHYCSNSGVSTFRDSPILRKANLAQLRGSAENLVTHHRIPHVDPDGVDNMSFSSDDILGGGSDVESNDDLDSDTEYSPGGRCRKRQDAGKI